jgi:hypothetical protein
MGAVAPSCKAKCFAVVHKCKVPAAVQPTMGAPSTGVNPGSKLGQWDQGCDSPQGRLLQLLAAPPGVLEAQRQQLLLTTAASCC